MTTPGVISSLTRASTANCPRSLKTRTYCPSPMPRSSASLGWMVSVGSPCTRFWCAWSPALEFR